MAEPTAPPVAPGERGDRSFWFTAGFIALVGLALAAPRLSLSMTGDEPFTANVVNQSVAEMMSFLATDNFQPVYYLLLRGWRLLFGETEVALRSLSWLVYGSAIVLIAGMGRRFFGRSAGLAAAGLLAASTGMGHFHAATARMYPLLFIETLAALFVLLALAEDGASPARRRVGAATLGGLFLIGVLTHPMFVFFALGLMFAAFLLGRNALRHVVWAALGSGTIYLLLWADKLQAAWSRPSLAWLNQASLGDLALGVVMIFGPAPTLLLLIALIVLLIARRGTIPPPPRTEAAVLAAWGGGFVILAFASQVLPLFFAPRTPALVLTGASLSAGCLLARLSPRAARVVVVAVLMLSTVVAFRMLPTSGGSARDSVLAVAGEVQCGETIVAGGLSFSEVTYYLRRVGRTSCSSVEPFPSEMRLHPGWMHPPDILRDDVGLREEASTLVSQMGSRPGTRAFIFMPTNPGRRAVVSVLMDSLQTVARLEEELQLAGSYFDAVRVYRIRRAP